MALGNKIKTALKECGSPNGVGKVVSSERKEEKKLSEGGSEEVLGKERQKKRVRRNERFQKRDRKVGS